MSDVSDEDVTRMLYEKTAPVDFKLYQAASTTVSLAIYTLVVSKTSQYRRSGCLHERHALR